MRATLKRTMAYVLAMALLVTCTVSSLVLPALADDPILYFEDGIITVPARFDSTYDVLSQLKYAQGYTLDASALQWSIADNQVRRYSTNSNPYGGTLFNAVTMNGSVVKTEACTTANSLSSQNKSGNWTFAHAKPTVTVTDGVNTATARIRWVYDEVPVLYDFENGQTLAHSASHTLNNYITQDLEGNYALRIPTNSRIPTRAYIYAAFAPNSVYKVSYRYKNEGTGTGTRMFTLNDQYDITMSPATLTTNATTTGWQTVEATVTTGAAPTVNYHYAYLFDRGSTSTNFVWMDDFKIELISTPATAITVKPEAPTVRKGAEKQFSFAAEPADGSVGEITWSVNDETKATINAQTGKLTALADSGTVEVTVTSSFGLTDSTIVTLAPEKVADPNVVFEADFEDGNEALSSHWSSL
ncbi:MAG: Ig-like domain-containing protein, partial [Clostridia bacterium]|nr:Ig-like domain-containing protein [Clostridia bacterium]